MTIGVDADALGGVKYVEFFGDVATTRVERQTVRRDTDARGNPRARVGFWLTLSAKHFQAVSTKGAIRIFARAVANNPDFQPRIIGNDLPAFLGDWKQQFWVRDRESDFAKTIGAGGNYPTIAAFFNAARAANAEAPKGTLITSGPHEMLNGNPGGAGVGAARGYATITAVDGVTATIGRSAPFDPEANMFAPNNFWRPGWPGIEFRGRGIVIDTKNVIGIRSESQCYFNGCRITNSQGPNWLTYWNAGLKPTFGVARDDGKPIPCAWQDGVSEFQAFHLAYGWFVSGWKSHDLIGAPASPSPFDRTNFVINTYLKDTNGEFMRSGGAGRPALRVGYSGPGAATLTVTPAGNAMFQPATVILKVSGVPVAEIKASLTPGTGPCTMSDLADAISAVPGWSATALLDDLGGRYLTWQNDKPIGKSTDLNTMADLHGEWFHSTTGQPTENIIHRGNLTVGDNHWTSGIWYGESDIRDAIVKSNVWQAYTDGGGGAGIGKGTYTTSHLVMTNNWMEGAIAVGNARCDRYCLIAQNVAAYLAASEFVDGMWKDNAIIGAQAIKGSQNTGNMKLSNKDFDATAADKKTYDFSPAGPLLRNLRPPIDRYDALGRERDATGDAIGPWAKGQPPPAPFNFAKD